MDGEALKKLGKRVISASRAGRGSDPHFYQGLDVLPNPDPILRAMGKADEVYDAIMSDAHVLGELRSIQAGLNSYKYRVKTGSRASETAQEKRARELCEMWLQYPPAPGMIWEDVIWNMGSAVLSGFRVHEVVWGIREGSLLPVELLDRPNRRFAFDPDNNLRLLTKAQPTKGEEVLAHEFILSRHMPSQTNPYGRAVLSACFWPYTFKKGGFKFFYQFCERYGLPFPIGKYPRGSAPNDQRELLDALLQLLQDGAAAIPDDASVDLLTSSHSGELAQEALVHLCNREMSKALTSQTLATEMQGGGSFAAAKTHADRQADTSHANRKAVAAAFNTLFNQITEFNVGLEVVAPVFEFFKESEPTKDRAEQYEIVARMSNRVPLAALHEEMNIPIAADGEEVLKASKPPAVPGVTSNEFSSGCPHCQAHDFAEGDEDKLSEAAIAAADKAIEQHLISPIQQMLLEYEEQGKSLREFLADIEKLGIRMDQNKLAEVNAEAMALAFARGMGETS